MGGKIIPGLLHSLTLIQRLEGLCEVIQGDLGECIPSRRSRKYKGYGTGIMACLGNNEVDMGDSDRE